MCVYFTCVFCLFVSFLDCLFVCLFVLPVDGSSCCAFNACVKHVGAHALAGTSVFFIGQGFCHRHSLFLTQRRLRKTISSSWSRCSVTGSFCLCWPKGHSLETNARAVQHVKLQFGNP